MYRSYKQFPELAGVDPVRAKQRYEDAKKAVFPTFRMKFGIAVGVCAVVGRVLFGHIGFAVGIGVAIAVGGYLMNRKICDYLKALQ